ncbi:hypothetical protein [Planotetraspora kaengkrachanensis]|uniref:Hemophore-related protein n=1 Tax=Planotetraspora kaengkrachanensis TaxID=575193 RepID=A0A8J3Q1B7_9ACTN|nr:hypothetical protein [Planotetraspora kaengkrachanensis]GIG84783.1 hypothetical protein Pka01_79100 [Planotetraspora kaengkrachanensis]
MRRRTTMTTAAVVLLAGAAGVTYAMTRSTAQTPCEAAAALVAKARESISRDASTIVFKAPDGSQPIWLGMTASAEELTSGSLETVEGEPSPKLVDALYEFSRADPTSAKDLTDPAGKVQSSLAHISAACP